MKNIIVVEDTRVKYVKHMWCVSDVVKLKEEVKIGFFVFHEDDNCLFVGRTKFANVDERECVWLRKRYEY
jgi:hypothetical protein